MDFDALLMRYRVPREALQFKKRFTRDDTPPKRTKLVASRYISPKRKEYERENDKDDFPFDTKLPWAMFFLHTSELSQWTTDRIDKLIELYQKQLELLPYVINANKVAYNNAKFIDKRRQFYYCYLLSLINGTPVISLSYFNDVVALTKLWRNREEKWVQENLKYPIQCCYCEGCFNWALYGSKYCFWHILKDEKQQLFEKCPRCNGPVMIGGKDYCRAHKVARTHKPI